MINVVMVFFALHDVARAKAARAHAAPLRPEPCRPEGAAGADRRPAEADPQGGVRADRRPRSRSTSSRRSSRCSPRSLAFSVLPFGGGWTLWGHHIEGAGRERPDLADPDLRPRLGRHLRLHHRRLGVRVEVLDPRLDAHLRAARLVRGLARAVRARRRADGPVDQPRAGRAEAAGDPLVLHPAVRRPRASS